MLKKRLGQYHSSPLVDYYRPKKFHSKVDVSPSANSVFTDFEKVFQGVKKFSETSSAKL